MKKFVVSILALVCVTCLSIPKASALSEFKKAFAAKYTDKEKDKEFATLVRKAGCNVCHVKGQKEKSPQNAYGKQLNKLIEGDAADRKKEAGDDSEKKGCCQSPTTQGTRRSVHESRIDETAGHRPNVHRTYQRRASSLPTTRKDGVAPRVVARNIAATAPRDERPSQTTRPLSVCPGKL